MRRSLGARNVHLVKNHINHQACNDGEERNTLVTPKIGVSEGRGNRITLYLRRFPVLVQSPLDPSQNELRIGSYRTELASHRIPTQPL